MDVEEAKKRAKKLIDDANPAAVIAVEKAGRNPKGVYHTARGSDISASTSKDDYLVDEARDRKLLTIGIGDLGNEIGFGKIISTVREVSGPEYAKCNCPCGGGAACAVETDVLVVASISNWGAYGTVGCLSGLLDNPYVLHDAYTQQRMIEACVGAGAIDGITITPTLSDDGVPLHINMHLIDMIRAIVESRTAISKFKYSTMRG